MILMDHQMLLRFREYSKQRFCIVNRRRKKREGPPRNTDIIMDVHLWNHLRKEDRELKPCYHWHNEGRCANAKCTFAHFLDRTRDLQNKDVDIVGCKTPIGLNEVCLIPLCPGRSPRSIGAGHCSKLHPENLNAVLAWFLGEDKTRRILPSIPYCQVEECEEQCSRIHLTDHERDEPHYRTWGTSGDDLISNRTVPLEHLCLHCTQSNNSFSNNCTRIHVRDPVWAKRVIEQCFPGATMNCIRGPLSLHSFKDIMRPNCMYHLYTPNRVQRVAYELEEIRKSDRHSFDNQSNVVTVQHRASSNYKGFNQPAYEDDDVPVEFAVRDRCSLLKIVQLTEGALRRLCKLATHSRTQDDWTQTTMMRYLKYYWIRLVEQCKVVQTYCQDPDDLTRDLLNSGFTRYTLVFRTGLYDQVGNSIVCVCTERRIEINPATSCEEARQRPFKETSPPYMLIADGIGTIQRRHGEDVDPTDTFLQPLFGDDSNIQRVGVLEEAEFTKSDDVRLLFDTNRWVEPNADHIVRQNALRLVMTRLLDEEELRIRKIDQSSDMNTHANDHEKEVLERQQRDSHLEELGKTDSKDPVGESVREALAEASFDNQNIGHDELTERNEGVSNNRLSTTTERTNRCKWKRADKVDEHITYLADEFDDEHLKSLKERMVLTTVHDGAEQICFTRGLIGVVLAEKRIQRCIRESQLLVQRCYSLAVPQLYYTTVKAHNGTESFNIFWGSLQLLLPIHNLEGKVIAALSISRTLGTEEKTYRATTVLPIPWARINARLIVEPQASWIRKE
eukprot:gb/GECG01001787.1/.p1 GENE.gb/GECG01001787.1/~~gb/GECG01001787.1/.p1  ORF type:complete len:787 (+),score=46.76 gb/GECG01001787.1/:1-2361(+)